MRYICILELLAATDPKLIQTVVGGFNNFQIEYEITFFVERVTEVEDVTYPGPCNSRKTPGPGIILEDPIIFNHLLTLSG